MAGFSSHAAVDLDLGTLEETVCATFNLLRSLVGYRLEGLDWLALLKIDGKGLVAILHSLLYAAASEYEDGPGDLWVVKGELPCEGLPTLVKLLPLQFTCNTSFQGTRQDEFEVHVIALTSSHLHDIGTSTHEVFLEEYEDSRIVRSW